MKKDGAAAENHSMFKEHCVQCQAPLTTPPIWCEICKHLQPPKDLSPFELLGLAPTLPINQVELQRTYFAYQRLVHPDCFIGASPSQQSYAQAWSRRLNDAYAVLKSPLTTIEHILQTKGYAIKEGTFFDLSVLSEALTLQEEIADATYDRLKNTIVPKLQAEQDDLIAQAMRQAENAQYGDLEKTYFRLKQRHMLLEQLESRC